MSLALVGTATGGSLQVSSADALTVSTAGITSGITATQVRQTVQRGLANSLGGANMLSANSLALNLSASVTALRIAFAAGATDFVSNVTDDALNILSLPPSNTSYVTADYVTPSTVRWASTLALPQYGNAYNKAAQSVLQFGGVAGSTSILDDFGNSWTAVGNARVQTNQFKFGTGGLGGGGANNVLNGSTDYVRTTAITNLGTGSWAMRAWVYPTSVPTTSGIFGATNAAGYGAMLDIGTGLNLAFNVSSNGTSFNAVSVAGTKTLVLNSWNFVEMAYDAVNGKYLTYVNGVLDISVTSALLVCPVTQLTVGARLSTSATFLTGYIDKFEFLPYCSHPNGVNYQVPTAAPNVTVQGYAADFFSIPLMTMYQVSAPSSVAGANPTFVAKNRVYVGEGTTTTNSTALVNYALNGFYDSGLFAIAASTSYARAHNLGTTQYNLDIAQADDILGTNERRGMPVAGTNYGYYGQAATRNQSAIGYVTNVGLTVAGVAATSGFGRMRVRRAF